MKRTALALFSALAFASSAAHAVEYTQVQADKSQIRFGYQQMGVSMDGTFGQFTSQLRFDPAAPEAAAATIEVALASIDTGSEEGDEVSTPEASRASPRTAEVGAAPRFSQRRRFVGNAMHGPNGYP